MTQRGNYCDVLSPACFGEIVCDGEKWWREFGSSIDRLSLISRICGICRSVKSVDRIYGAPISPFLLFRLSSLFVCSVVG